MIEKLLFITHQYLLVFLFGLACFGWGLIVLSERRHPSDSDPAQTVFLRCSLGAGGVIVGLQLLGLIGWFRLAPIVLLLSIGWLRVLFFAFTHRETISLYVSSKWVSRFRSGCAGAGSSIRNADLVSMLLALTCIELLLRGLHPPIQFDELMYQLTHAREWALNGAITVNEWYRVPLFPYNFNLLYAMGLVFGSETFTHLVHSAAGGWAAFGLYLFAAKNFGRTNAILATLIFLVAVRREFGHGSIDLGLTLFVLAGYLALHQWIISRRLSMLIAAFFLLGVAAGTKYQGLLFATVAFATLVYKSQSLRTWFFASLGFLGPCIYWFLRSFLVSGDPVHPMLGSIFGYWNWGEIDTQGIRADLKRVADWPNIGLWPALFGLLLLKKQRHPAFTSIALFSVVFLLLWFFTSHYSRYLFPAYPAMAILSAAGIITGYTALGRVLSPRLAGFAKKSVKGISWFGVIVAVGFLLSSLSKKWDDVPATSELRNKFVARQVKSSDVASEIHLQPSERVLQFGYEGEIYYLPRAVIGDSFGSARYGEFLKLNNAELKQKLQALNVRYILIAKAVGDLKLLDKPGFNQDFELIKEGPDSFLFRHR
jgi:hypothetical protein